MQKKQLICDHIGYISEALDLKNVNEYFFLIKFEKKMKKLFTYNIHIYIFYSDKRNISNFITIET